MTDRFNIPWPPVSASMRSLVSQSMFAVAPATAARIALSRAGEGGYADIVCRTEWPHIDAASTYCKGGAKPLPLSLVSQLCPMSPRSCDRQRCWSSFSLLMRATNRLFYFFSIANWHVEWCDTTYDSRRRLEESVPQPASKEE